MSRRLHLLVLLLAFSGAAHADELLFTGGERLLGKLVSLQAGKLTFHSSLVGKVEIPVGTLEKLATTEPIEIHMADGTVFRDRAVLGESGELRTAGSSSIGTQRLRLADLSAINPSPESPVVWRPDLTVSAKAERGNTIKNEADLFLKAVRESEENRIRIEASYEGERNTDRDTEIGTTSDRKIEGELKYDEFFADPWYWLTRTKATRDGVAELDLRFMAGGGLGYRVIKTPRTSFDLEAGLLWISDHYKDTSKDDDYPGVLFSWYLDHGITDRVKVFSTLDWFIAAEDWDDRFFADLDVGLRSHITPEFYVETRIEWEYFTETSGETERQDVDYIFGLGYRF